MTTRIICLLSCYLNSPANLVSLKSSFVSRSLTSTRQTRMSAPSRALLRKSLIFGLLNAASAVSIGHSTAFTHCCKTLEICGASKSRSEKYWSITSGSSPISSPVAEFDIGSSACYQMQNWRLGMISLVFLLIKACFSFRPYRSIAHPWVLCPIINTFSFLLGTEILVPLTENALTYSGNKAISWANRSSTWMRVYLISLRSTLAPRLRYVSSM